MPPRMSSVSSIPPKFGVSADLLYGTGVLPVIAIPCTCEVAEPPTCGKISTSYFARRFPSRSFWSEK